MSRLKHHRLYIEWSSWFDTHDYDIQAISKALKGAGAVNIRTANAYGWSNQPKVVTFRGMDRNKAEGVVGKVLNTQWIIASPHWNNGNVL